MTTIVAIAGAKGGCGKTTTAINLTSAFKQLGRNPLLVDLHFERPHVGIYLGLDIKKTVNDYLKGKTAINTAMYRHASEIVVIPAVHDEQCSRKDVGRLFTELLNTAEVVLVDTPSSVGQFTQAILAEVDAVILITTQTVVSVADTQKTAMLARSLGKRILGVVVTHVTEREFDLSLESIETSLDCKIIGSIPYDEQIHHAQAKEYPLPYADFNAPATFAYKKLAAYLIGDTYEPQKKMSFIGYLLRRLGLKD